mgnify:FL=1|jgi:hypothetical protein
MLCRSVYTPHQQHDLQENKDINLVFIAYRSGNITSYYSSAVLDAYVIYNRQTGLAIYTYIKDNGQTTSVQHVEKIEIEKLKDRLLKYGNNRGQLPKSTKIINRYIH